MLFGGALATSKDDSACNIATTLIEHFGRLVGKQNSRTRLIIHANSPAE